MDNHYGKETRRLVLKEAEVTLRNLSKLSFGDFKQPLDIYCSIQNDKWITVDIPLSYLHHKYTVRLQFSLEKQKTGKWLTRLKVTTPPDSTSKAHKLKSCILMGS